MTSCQKEEFLGSPIQQVKEKVVVSAILADADKTKTQHSSDFKKVQWSANDLLSVFSSVEKCHDRYYIINGAGTVSANFQWDKTYNGTISGRIDAEGAQQDFYVGVYPFNEETSVKFSEGIYEINTVLPTNQFYAENSFGQGALVMIGVDQINSKPNFSFKNTGTILIFPLKGNALINSATLKSEKSKIAGKAVVKLSAEDNFIPETTVNDGEHEITLSCGEGVQLKEDEYTNFCFVLAPGVYDDLVVKFTDTYGNYFEQEILNPNGREMARSMSYNMPKMTFEANGTEDINLWIKAIAPAYANAERIVPSVNDINLIEWVKNLAHYDGDIKSMIENVILQASLGDYKQVYDILGGIPGFVKQTRTFEVTGIDIQKLQYSYTQHIESLIAEIANIDTADEFVAYVNKLSTKYEGFEESLDNSLGTVGSYLDKYLQGYDELTKEEKLAVKINKIIEEIDKDINTLKGIQKEEYLNIVNDYISQLTSLKSVIIACKTDEEISNAMNAFKLDAIREQTGSFWGIPQYKWFYYGFNGQVKLGAINAEIFISEQAQQLIKADLFKPFIDINITQYLIDKVEDKEGIVYKTVSRLFENPEFVESVKKTLTNLVKEYEEMENSMIDKENVQTKEQAILLTKGLVIAKAQENARIAIMDAIEDANVKSIDYQAWNLFKRILAWEECVNLFNKYNIIEVHTALENLCLIVGDLVTYEKVGTTQFTLAADDYVEGEHWWVLKYNEEL